MGLRELRVREAPTGPGSQTHSVAGVHSSSVPGWVWVPSALHTGDTNGYKTTASKLHVTLSSAPCSLSTFVAGDGILF